MKTNNSNKNSSGRSSGKGRTNTQQGRGRSKNDFHKGNDFEASDNSKKPYKKKTGGNEESYDNSTRNFSKGARGGSRTGSRSGFSKNSDFERPDNSEKPYKKRAGGSEESFNNSNRSFSKGARGGSRTGSRSNFSKNSDFEGADSRKPYKKRTDGNEESYNNSTRSFAKGTRGGSRAGSNFRRSNDDFETSDHSKGAYKKPGAYDDVRKPDRDFRKSDGFARPVKKSDEYDPHAKYSRKKQLEYKKSSLRESDSIRLNRFLANAGICSRREADEYIKAGVVTVNGEVVSELGTKVTMKDKVMFHDQPVRTEKKVYILINKPKDCVTTSDDPQERFTVMDLIKDACSERVYPVGRLDRNTTGVLLLTNDGDLAAKLTHPKYNKKKIYHVFLDKPLTKNDMQAIADGIKLEDGEIHADQISYADDTDKRQVGIEIHSGRNRIVRRIFEHFGYKVEKLDRVYFAGLTKKNLSRGKFRFLTEKELNMLKMGSYE